MGEPQTRPAGKHRWLRLLLAGLGCCLALEIGAGQGPVIVNRLRATLGAPEEVWPAAPTVLEFAPSQPPQPPMKVVLEFDSAPPPNLAVLPTTPASLPPPPNLAALPTAPTSVPLPPKLATLPSAPASLPALPGEPCAELASVPRFAALERKFPEEPVEFAPVPISPPSGIDVQQSPIELERARFARAIALTPPQPTFVPAIDVQPSKSLPPLTLTHDLSEPFDSDYRAAFSRPIRSRQIEEPAPEQIPTSVKDRNRAPGTPTWAQRLGTQPWSWYQVNSSGIGPR